jgi:hypothetical protein
MKKATTWNKVQGVDDCTNCKRDERVHVWVCDGCGRQLDWADYLLPVDCTCGIPRAATLWCPEKRTSMWLTGTLVVSVCLTIGYLIGWALAKAIQ